MNMVKKEKGLLIPFLQVVTDVIAMEAAFLCSYYLRFHSPLVSIIPVTRGIPSLRVYMVGSLALILIWLFIMGSNRMYGVRRNASRVDELSGLVKSVTTGMILAAAAAFFYREYSFSRLVFGYIWLLGIFFLSFTRLSILGFEKSRHRRGKDIVKGAVAGSGVLGNELFNTIDGHPGLGIKMIGYIGKPEKEDLSIRCLGQLDEISEIIENEGITVLFIALDVEENDMLVPMLSGCVGMHVEFYLVPDMMKMVTSRFRVEQFDGYPLLKLKDSAIDGWGAVFKRVFDILFSAASLLLLSPVFLITSLAVKSGSKGHVFYRQERIGLDGRKFDLLKFRSMRVDAENKSGPVWTVKQDDRVTGIGRFLRRFSLDELPQLINVLRGDMSLVGPRPERPHFVDRFSASVSRYAERHRVRSGMTGWAQVNGLRGDVPIEDRTKYDVYYVENWSFMLDVRIIIRTVWTVLRGDNSY
ncbi:MAG: undecaprenyl-phosphate glucose phosphotransferase [Bacteroidales bacterium]|nr:undecaprenyl-phosphate glucose phosphotransferase [Candidatus Latescibacterota bacterium]